MDIWWASKCVLQCAHMETSSSSKLYGQWGKVGREHSSRQENGFVECIGNTSPEGESISWLQNKRRAVTLGVIWEHWGRGCKDSRGNLFMWLEFVSFLELSTKLRDSPYFLIWRGITGLKWSQKWGQYLQLYILQNKYVYVYST